MTGFGHGRNEGSRFRVEMEIRSLNRRFLEMSVRLPPLWDGQYSLEERIRVRVAQVLKRGRIDIVVRTEAIRACGGFRVDTNRAVSYYKSLEDLRERLGLPTPVHLDLLFYFPDLMVQESNFQDVEAAWQDVSPALERALDMLVDMRKREGAALAEDLRGGLFRLKEWTKELRSMVPQVREAMRTRFEDKLRQWLGTVDGPEKERLCADMVQIVERFDLNEEIVRLESHMDQLADALTLQEPVGRRLDFLLQEMHREIQTIGAKSQDVRISDRVVSMKTELERLREQVQNIE